jgi:hypothetical protein
MSAPAKPELQPGRVYRTRDLERWSANAPRLAKRLVDEGVLVPLAHGLFVHPEKTRFGMVPPKDEELMRAFLDGSPFVFTGPARWNALGLGSTALHAVTLVYNRKRTTEVELGARRFVLRRVRFPDHPSPEWYAVDLLEHADEAGVELAELRVGLARALAAGRLDSSRHLNAAQE